MMKFRFSTIVFFAIVISFGSAGQDVRAELVYELSSAQLTPRDDPWGLGVTTPITLKFTTDLNDSFAGVSNASFSVTSVTMTIAGMSETTSNPGASSYVLFSDNISQPPLGDRMFFFASDVNFNGTTADIAVAAFLGESFSFTKSVELPPLGPFLPAVGMTGTATTDYSSIVNAGSMLIATPEPTSLFMFSTALLAGVRRRRIAQHRPTIETSQPSAKMLCGFLVSVPN